VRKHWGKTLFGVAVTVAALWWALRGEDLGEIWRQMRQGDVLLLTAGVAIATFGFFIRALRWKVLLTPVKADTSLRARFAAVSIGFMANNVLPLRAGEFARPYAFSRMEPVSASAAFGSLVVERFLDGLVLMILLVGPVLTPGFPVSDVLSHGLGAFALRGTIVVLAGVALSLMAMAVWPRGFVRLAERVADTVLPATWARPLVSALEAFLDSIALLRSPRLMAIAFAWSLAFWLWHGLSFWLAMQAFGIHTGVLSAWFTEAVVGVGVAVPSAPGFIGTFHASVKFALTDIYGVDASRSLAFAFGFWAGGWFPITAIGLYYAWRLGLSLGEVGAAEERVEEMVEGEHAVGAGAGTPRP
jgi:glycosyltransferase 2 family protein